MMLHIQGATPKNDELARIELPNFTVYKESFLMFRPASIKTDYWHNCQLHWYRVFKQVWDIDLNKISAKLSSQ